MSEKRKVTLLTFIEKQSPGAGEAVFELFSPAIVSRHHTNNPDFIRGILGRQTLNCSLVEDDNNPGMRHYDLSHPCIEITNLRVEAAGGDYQCLVGDAYPIAGQSLSEFWRTGFCLMGYVNHQEFEVMYLRDFWIYPTPAVDVGNSQIATMVVNVFNWQKTPEGLYTVEINGVWVDLTVNDYEAFVERAIADLKDTQVSFSSDHSAPVQFVTPALEIQMGRVMGVWISGAGEQQGQLQAQVVPEGELKNIMINGDVELKPSFINGQWAIGAQLTKSYGPQELV